MSVYSEKINKAALLLSKQNQSPSQEQQKTLKLNSRQINSVILNFSKKPRKNSCHPTAAELKDDRKVFLSNTEDSKGNRYQSSNP